MEVTAAMVKELRERTQAGMMDCTRLWSPAMAIWIKLLNICARRASLPSPRRPAASRLKAW